MKIHLIGIAGTGMGALARLLKEAGHQVEGSDSAVYPPMSEQLAAAQIPVHIGYSADNLAWGPQTVVVGNVCRVDHVEVLAAQARGLTLESFPSMLASALLYGRRSLVVAGTHGKTTTTSLVAWILRVAEQDPSFLIGGVPTNFETGAHLGSGPAMVVEGDEYDTAFFDKKSKFLHYRPHRAILTGVEYDHVDMFADFEQMRDAFAEFVATIDEDGDLIVNFQDANAMGVAAGARCNVVTYAVLADEHADPESADVCILERDSGGGRRSDFEVFERGQSLGEFSTQMVGRYNLGNIAAAVAMARREGVEPAQLADAIRRFRGVKRRQELVGMAAGVRVIADFAHHPTAAALTCRAIRKRYPEKALHVCFEPRSSSSRRSEFADAYAKAFDAASHVYVAPVFRPDKVPSGQLLDTLALAEAISARQVRAAAFQTIKGMAAAVIERVAPGDTVLLLSSGSFGGLGDEILSGLGDPVMFARPEDAKGVQDLLEGYGLPAIISSDGVETLVLRGPEGIAGCVSLEVARDGAFLFGLAVTPQRRGEGLGWVLGDIVLRRARTLGARHCYLITNTATDFFAGKLGFSRVDRQSVEPEIQAKANFQAGSEIEGAVCMVVELPTDGSWRRH